MCMCVVCCRYFRNSHVTFGALGDSFYEYLLKLWILSGGVDQAALNMYNEAIVSMPNLVLLPLISLSLSLSYTHYTLALSWCVYIIRI